HASKKSIRFFTYSIEPNMLTAAHSTPESTFHPRRSTSNGSSQDRAAIGALRGCIGCSIRVQRRSVALPRRPRRQKHGRRPPLRARPPARQQIQREHQNPAQISELEYPVPPRNPADEMIVNLD